MTDKQPIEPSENITENNQIEQKEIPISTHFEVEKKQKEGLSQEEKQTRNKRILRKSLIAFVIIGLSVGVFFLSPKNMYPGLYQVDLTFNVYNQDYDVSFFITMSNASITTKQEQLVPLGSSNVSCLIIKHQTYKSSTNSKIEFYVGLLNATNQPLLNFQLTNVTGKIVGEGLNRNVRPVEIKSLRSSTLDIDVRMASFSMAVPYSAGISLPLLVIVAGLWLTEIVPTVIGALLVPVVITFSQISSATVALQPFFDPVIALFFGGFIIAEALKKHNLDRRFALTIAAYSTSRPNILLLIFLAFTAFLSLWMSNTAVAAVTIPIAIALADQIQKNERNEQNSMGYRKALILGAGYAATIGGIGTIVGTPSNPIAVAALEKINDSVSFLEWMGFGLPFVIILIVVLWGHLILMFRPKVSKESMKDAQKSFKVELGKMGKISGKQWTTLAIFIGTIVLWILEEPIKNWTGGSLRNISGVIALSAAICIFAFGLLDPKDIRRLNWEALLLFGGGLCLGNALVSTGIGDWIASNIGAIAGQHLIVIALVLGGIAVVVTAIASNTASAAMLIPLIIPIAVTFQLNARLLAVLVAIATSVDFTLVFGTPPTLLSYSTGHFSVKEIFKVGSVLSLLGLVLLSTVTIYIWFAFGLVSL